MSLIIRVSCHQRSWGFGSYYQQSETFEAHL
jgi:hypothetical protein